MSENKQKQTLASKLAKIGYEIGKIDKSGINREQKYNYIEYSVVAGRIRELLDKYHVIIVPSVQEVHTDEVQSKYGNKGYHYVVTMQFNIFDGEDDEGFSATWRGEATDFGDKGINKAITSGTKYFLMRLFNISEKGDEDNDSTTPEQITSINPLPKFTQAQIAGAKIKLGTTTSLEQLREVYRTLGEIGKSKEIISYCEELKIKLQEKDNNV